LRIIGEFDYIKLAIVALHQVGLGAPAHFADEVVGLNGHGAAA